MRQLREVALDYFVAAKLLLHNSGASSVNAAVRSGNLSDELEAKLQELERLTGESRGDFLFVIVERRTHIEIQRTHRRTEYPEHAEFSVGAIPCAIRN